jgi:hypothetical protein
VQACGAERQEGWGRVPSVCEGEARGAAGLVDHGRGQRRQACFRGHGQAQQRRQGDDDDEQGRQGQEHQGGRVVVQPEAAPLLGAGAPSPVPAGAAAARRVPRLVPPRPTVLIKLRYPSSSPTVRNLHKLIPLVRKKYLMRC